MSTPKSLVLQLRPSDRNRTITGKFGSLNPEGHKFLLIYVHCDCDAKYLFEKNFTYQEALDFIMEGDRSNLQTGSAYLGRPGRDEVWEGSQPEATDTPYPFDFGSLLMITRTDDPNEEVTVLEWDAEEEDYLIAD
jgi:hypothetical protein